MEPETIQKNDASKKSPTSRGNKSTSDDGGLKSHGGIENYTGETFVAFIDISGFKNMMRQGYDVAQKALDTFYKAGYDVIHENNEKVNGLFVSDCGVLFERSKVDPIQKLNNILGIVKTINSNMLDKDYLLTTSIAWGPFTYKNKIEIKGISKTYIVGNAYLKAYFDNEDGRPKIQPGSCRLLKDKLPKEIKSNSVTNLRDTTDTHYYYYWNVSDDRQIDDYIKNYTEITDNQYVLIKDALKNYI